MSDTDNTLLENYQHMNDIHASHPGDGLERTKAGVFKIEIMPRFMINRTSNRRYVVPPGNGTRLRSL